MTNVESETMRSQQISDLKKRTKRFAIDAIRFSAGLPHGRESNALVHQFIRCASSVGANYRAACRARSVADFLSKMSIVEEEADEAMYWSELIEGLGLSRDAELSRLKDEADQLVAIAVASKKTARTNHPR